MSTTRGRAFLQTWLCRKSIDGQSRDLGSPKRAAVINADMQAGAEELASRMPPVVRHSPGQREVASGLGAAAIDTRSSVLPPNTNVPFITATWPG